MGNDYSSILCSNIARYRKMECFTQEKFANLLGVSTQAVSKWESQTCCPDISLLPQIANIFNVSIDELFGKVFEREVIYNAVGDLPWNDDEKFRIVFFTGKKILNQEIYECKQGKDTILFEFHGSPYDFKGNCKIHCTPEKRSEEYSQNEHNK